MDNNLHGKGGVSGIEHRKGAETGHTVSGRLCTGRFIYLYDRLPGNRFLGYPESDADFFSGNRDYFLYLLKRRGLLGLGMVLIGMTAAGQLLLAGIVMYFGMSIGGMLSVMILRYGWKGIMLGLGFCLPQDLFYIPAGSMGISLMAAYGRKKNDRLQIYHTGEKKKNQLRRILSVLGVTIIGILAECYVNPLLVKTVLKIF